MLDQAMTGIEAAGLSGRTTVFHGTVEELPDGDGFDAATWSESCITFPSRIARTRSCESSAAA
jgi:hypothetical protein